MHPRVLDKGEGRGRERENESYVVCVCVRRNHTWRIQLRDNLIILATYADTCPNINRPTDPS